jgi:non-ribosomal peptide synthase protein (TIGR01720 family)
LGGDSILSIQIISRLRKEGLILKANTLFNHQTIKELAPYVEYEKSDNENIQDLLIEIWEEVLQIKPVNIDDNFFELGGDSILSIQIISRLRKKGYHLKANTLFNHQTIKELSLFVKKEENEIVPKASDGELILTPIQHWFFENHKNAPHFWNQIYEVDIPQSFSNANLERIILKLIETYDGLRLGFIKKNEIWESNILSHQHDKALVYKDFSDVKEQDLETVVEDFIYEQQDNYSLINNYLFRGLLLNLANDRPKKLYLIAHHLIVDQISKLILEKDFAELYDQTIKKKPLHLIKSPSTYRSYNTKLNQLKDALDLKNSFEYWKSQINVSQKLPVDYEYSLPILEHDIEKAVLRIDRKLTQSLQEIAKNKSNLTVEEILLASLTKTICEWSNTSEFIMLKENLGRQIEDHHSDYSETVGWLTSIHPLKVGYKDNLDLKSFILAIKETVRNIPNKGLEYGILRYLVEDESIKKSLSFFAPVVFNYLGNMTKSNGIHELEFRTKEANFRSNLSERDYFFEINTYIKNNILEVNWSYNTKCHTAETITNLLTSFHKDLELIVDFCSKHDGNIYSASDFPDSDLDNDDLNELLSQL